MRKQEGNLLEAIETSKEFPTEDESSQVPSPSLRILDCFGIGPLIKNSVITMFDTGSNISATGSERSGFEEIINEDSKVHLCYKDELEAICETKGRNSDEATEQCALISDIIMGGNTSIKKVWAAYRLANENKIVFVVYADKEITADDIKLPVSLKTLDIECRYIEKYSEEDEHVMYSEERLNKPFTKDELTRIQDRFVETTKELLNDHSNLSIVKACSVKSKNFGKASACLLPETCIVLYVHTKGLIPIKEDAFPTQINGFPTDVREGTFMLFGNNAKEYHKSIRMGCQITGECQKSGTLGPLVDLPNNKVGCIMSAHVVLFNKCYAILQQAGMAKCCESHHMVFQPNNIVPEPPFGRVLNGAYRTGGDGVAGVEVAIVEITDSKRLPSTGLFPKEDFQSTGLSDAEPMKYTSGRICNNPDAACGMVVKKYGSETGTTVGKFELSGPVVCRNTLVERYDGLTVVLNDQLQVLSSNRELPFAAPGDSGSLVFIRHEGADDDLRPVGILTGGTARGRVCFITPIGDILDVFNLNLSLKQFPTNTADGVVND